VHANTVRALAVVRFGHRPPARHKHTDRTDYNVPLASAQCKYLMATSVDEQKSLHKLNPFKLAKAIDKWQNC